MSRLGDLIRVSPALRADLAADPVTVYDRVTDFAPPERLELDWEWRPFGELFEAAGFAVNPFRSGELFPDEETAFYEARTLGPAQVAEVAGLLTRTAFEQIAPLLPAEWERNRELLTGSYRALTDFYRTAAGRGECTVFWAA
jgi:hypothetical protein